MSLYACRDFNKILIVFNTLEGMFPIAINSFWILKIIFVLEVINYMGYMYVLADYPYFHSDLWDSVQTTEYIQIATVVFGRVSIFIFCYRNSIRLGTTVRFFLALTLRRTVGKYIWTILYIIIFQYHNLYVDS